MELVKIKADAGEKWEDVIALEIDGIQVKKQIPYESKRSMAILLESLTVVEDKENEVIYDSTLFDVAFFVLYCIFYTNIDADLTSSEAWVQMYDYATQKGYVKAFYTASADDLEIVRGIYGRIRDIHVTRYNKEHSVLNKLAAQAQQTEDEASVRMGERILDILEERKAPISYLNLPVDLAKKEVE